MLPLLALLPFLLRSLVPSALAGDQALYDRALQLIDAHYLRPETLTPDQMLAGAADHLETRIEWLLTDTSGGVVSLRDGHGDWKATVTLDRGQLGPALAKLEDAVRSAERPIDPEIDLRVEILRGAVKSLDRHSVVLHAAGLERFDERLSGTLSGVGATISVDDDGLFVRDLVEGGPAARGGLRPADRLLTIDGVSTVGMVPGDATDRIRGAVGTTVTLAVLRGAARVTLVLRREELTIRNVEASRGPGGVGVVTIAHFSEQTRTYLAEALSELAANGGLQQGLIIDLRGNTGGSLLQSAQAADTFLQAGLIVSTVGRGGAPVPGLVPRLDAHPESPGHTMPIAVLMDHATASGSEILAGALARLDRAILIGATSFGKGTVQKVYQLDPAIKLKLTVAEYLLEGGTHVADIGLVPDIALEAVRFDEGGAWYPSPVRERRRFRPGTPILRHASGEEDRALEVAAAVVSAASGPTRQELLASARGLESSLAAAEDVKVAAAFKQRGIDWSAAPAPPDGDPVVEVRWSLSTQPAAGQTTQLVATVTNRGPTLYRAALRLESVNPAWDDLVLPLGRLERGESRAGTVTVSLDRGLSTRTDRVGVTLEADGIASRTLLPHAITTVGEPLPVIAVTARALPTGTANELRIALDVENRSDRLLSALEARVAFPNVEGIELVDAVSDSVSAAAHSTARLELRLRVSSTWRGDILPLDVTVTGEGKRLTTWDLQLQRNGAPLRLESPSLTVESLEGADLPTVLPVGSTRLRIRASDDRGLDHMVVYAGPETMNRVRTTPTLDHDREKMAWRATTGRRTELDLVVPIVAGTNHYVIVAEDRAGLRTQRDLYILGDDTGPAVTATPD
ncbi:MAG: S41 family peptidase [Pseudomonadota bacterium]|nr:S41 family peptidase [Pseudomonadota bacterium]